MNETAEPPVRGIGIRMGHRVEGVEHRDVPVAQLAGEVLVAHPFPAGGAYDDFR